MSKEIPFNSPFISGKEREYLNLVLESRKWSGDGPFTRKAQEILKSRYRFNKALLASSCTDALEMAAILSGVGPGDEVIVPSYTFVSTVNPFVLRGAQPVFVDSTPKHPNLDVEAIESLVTPRTKVIVVMHYGGVACPMEEVLDLASRKGLLVVEDAAQCIDAYYKGKPLGSLGHFGTFSFHETKNISCGEGGALLVNDPNYEQRAEIIREKGTNRTAFFRGEVAKYGWVDIGSSFLPSEFNAAVLTAQFEALDEIQARRIAIWNRYHAGLASLAERQEIQFPSIPSYATNNAHLFYLVLQDLGTRTRYIAHLKSHRIHPVFHYQSLHQSPFFANLHDGRKLPQADRYSDCLVRLPFYKDLSDQDVDHIIDIILGFFAQQQR